MTTSLSPGFLASITLERSPPFVIVLPSSFVITSLVCRPALPAGSPEMTSASSAPGGELESETLMPM